MTKLEVQQKRSSQRAKPDFNVGPRKPHFEYFKRKFEYGIHTVCNPDSLSACLVPLTVHKFLSVSGGPRQLQLHCPCSSLISHGAQVAPYTEKAKPYVQPVVPYINKARPYVPPAIIAAVLFSAPPVLLFLSFIAFITAPVRDGSACTCIAVCCT